MAEISYPYTEKNASGATDLVSQVQWQRMATTWGGDCVDFQLTAGGYSNGSLPFDYQVVNGRSLQLGPGAAVVGGFHYELTSALALDVLPNPTDQTRLDTIVIRTDLTRGATNLAIVKGQPATIPIAPQPQRVPGQIWEMVLYEIIVAPKDGVISPRDRRTFRTPSPVGMAWNVEESSKNLVPGTFVLDMDADGSDTQYEGWRGRDGYMVTRHLGRSLGYTPRLARATNAPAELRAVGRWRFIAPGTVWFTARIQNATDITIRTNGESLGLGLPMQASGTVGQVLTGHLQNPYEKSGMPNFMLLQALCWEGNGMENPSLYTQSQWSAADGMDVLTTMPAQSSIYFSGVYEANVFNERG
ncbi:hypothetical protein [Embleya hyalina]|uniref:Uncharacterized protein n=1 Tax=Embleya hyalina TaxID=516124 RepID=A0A401YZ46_9ACTN|nr:hypothetical protein [Embleya hyalina]GCD99867.1 hypothetical protein EHYA_07589 [Embleya hyalina]